MKISISNIQLRKSLPASIVVAGLLIAGALFYTRSQAPAASQGGSQGILTSQDAAARVISFVDESLAANGVTSTAALGNINEESGVYTVSFSIDSNPYTAYVTKDGKYLFPEGYDMTATSASPSGASSTNQ